MHLIFVSFSAQGKGNLRNAAKNDSQPDYLSESFALVHLKLSAGTPVIRK